MTAVRRTIARFRCNAPTRGSMRPRPCTLEIDARNPIAIVRVRPLRARQTYTVTLDEVASFVVWIVSKARARAHAGLRGASRLGVR